MKNVNIVRTIVILLLLTVVFAIYGYVFHYGYDFDDAAYKMLKLFTLGSDSVPEESFAVNIARFLAPIVVICGGVQIIYFISQNGWKYLCLWTFKKHTIICGYGTTGKSIVSQLDKKGRKHLIIIDPLIEKNKVSFSKIFLNKSASDVNVLKNEAKVDKASEIIIATGSDYENMTIYNMVKKYNNIKLFWVRLEQLKEPENLENFSAGITKFFNLSKDVTKKLKSCENQLIVVLGFGSVGKRIVEFYKGSNEILVIEQSETAIHMAKDVYNSSNIKYERADVKGLMEKDLIEILEKHNNKNLRRINLFICLGGDWLGFRTAWCWLSWKRIELNINLIGLCINEELFKLGYKDRITIQNLSKVEVITE